jgi:hypothetical protein
MSTIDIDDATEKTATPFGGSAPAPAPAVDELAPHAELGATASVDLSHLAGVLAAADPEHVPPRPIAEPPADAAGGRMTEPYGYVAVERYAAVVAHTEDGSEQQHAEVHRRYGIESDAARRALDEEMEAKMAADPSLRARFHTTVGQWRDWLERQPGD